MRRSFPALWSALAVSTSLTATSGAFVQPAEADTPAPTQGDIGQQQTRVDELQSKAEALRQESQALGGSRTVRESIRTVKGTIIGLDQDIAHTEERVEKMSENKADLDRMREEVGKDETLFGLGDAAEAGVKHKVLGAVEHRLLHGGAGTVVGALGWLMIPVKIGIRQYYVMVRRSDLHDQRMKESNLIIDKLRFIRIAQEEKNAKSQDLKRLEQIQKEENANNALIAKEREKLRVMQESPDGKPVLDREFDLPGDKQVERDYWRERNKGGVTPSTQQSMYWQPGLGANANVAFGTQEFPTFVYLGFENVALVQTFAVENLDDDENFTAFNGEAIINLDEGYRYTGEIDPDARAFIALGFITFGVDGSTFRDVIDPLGQDLLIAFPVTPGISLGSGVPEGTPGGANVVSDFVYRYDADQLSLYGKFGQTWACDDGALTGYAGLAYTNLDQRQWASGDINGFASDFRYDTDIEVDAWRVIGGMRYDSPSIAGFRLFAAATGSLNFVDASGRDSINVSGFLNFSERADLSTDDTTFGYALDVGVATHIDEPAMDLYLAYRHFHDETTPVVVRHDNDPGHIEIEGSDFDMIVAGARIRF